MSANIPQVKADKAQLLPNDCLKRIAKIDNSELVIGAVVQLVCRKSDVIFNDTHIHECHQNIY